MELPPRPAWKAAVRLWMIGPNLPYLCLVVIGALSLISRVVLLWR